MPISKGCISNKQVLTELIGLLESTPDSIFTRGQLHDSKSPVSSVGAHTRHIIEFYRGFFRGLSTRVINYDDRKRSPELEQNRTSAILALKSICQALSQLPSAHADQPAISLKAQVDTLGTELEMPTCITRELVFLQNHSVHHQALIALLMANFQQSVPDEFGVATSTRINRQEQEA